MTIKQAVVAVRQAREDFDAERGLSESWADAEIELEEAEEMASLWAAFVARQVQRFEAPELWDYSPKELPGAIIRAIRRPEAA